MLAHQELANDAAALVIGLLVLAFLAGGIVYGAFYWGVVFMDWLRVRRTR